VKEGLLKKVGYNVNAKPKTRRAAVARAVKKYGRASTIRKLNAVAVFTKRTSPMKSRKFKTDMKVARRMTGRGMFTDAALSMAKRQGMSVLNNADPEMMSKLRSAATEVRSKIDPETASKFGDLASHLKAKAKSALMNKLNTYGNPGTQMRTM